MLVPGVVLIVPTILYFFSSTKLHPPNITLRLFFPCKATISHQKMSKMPGIKSALLPLPRELRDCIYEYLLTRHVYVMNPRPQDVFSSAPLLRQPELAILIVSRSTYDEAKRALYRHGHFHFSVLRAGLPPLPQEIRRIPGLEKVQEITINIDPRIGSGLGYENTKVIEYGTALINYFAGLDSGIQRKSCVIEVSFFTALDFLDVALEITDGFKDAIGRLTGFKAVKLKISYITELMGPRRRTLGPRQVLNTLCTSLDEMLALKLGKGEQMNGRKDHRWIYHPQQV